MKKKISGKTIFNVCIMSLAAILIIYFAFSKNGLLDLAKNIPAFSVWWILTAFLCMFVYWGLDSVIIFIFVRHSCPGFKLKYAARSTMIGQFYSAITPFSSGGQPLQVYEMSRRGVSPGVSTSALIQKFLIYQWVTTAYSALAIILRYGMFRTKLDDFMILGAMGFGIQALVIVALILFSNYKRLTNKLIRGCYKLLGKLHLVKNIDKSIETAEKQVSVFYENNKKISKNYKIVAVVSILTFLQITVLMIIPYFIARTFSLMGATVVDMTAANAFVYMVSAFMPLPGASGASEGGFYYFFRIFFSDATIKPALVIWRTITYYFAMAASLPFAKLGKSKGKTEEDAEPILSEN